jgi:hypothetical protein
LDDFRISKLPPKRCGDVMDISCSKNGREGRSLNSTIYIIKELVQPKMSLKREFLIWKERGRG